MGQGYEDHLVTQETDIPEVDRVQWKKIDAQLCSVLWQSVDPRILLHLQAYKTCFKFWTQAKGLYTNDIQRLYKVASAIVHISQQDLDLSTYIGQIACLKEEFLTVMPLTPDVGAQQTQLDKFFIVLTLIGHRPDLEPIRDQILGSSSVPSLDDVFARLLLVPEVEANVLHCTYCNKLGHTRDRCYQLHGRPPRTAHMAQSSDSPLPQPPSSSASQTSQASIASVAQPGIGLALSLPSLPLTSVLYTPECPFNLISISKLTRTLNCSITFSDKIVTLQDRSTGKTIGIGRESQGLYHLTSDSSAAVCISTDAPLLIHNRLGHPSLSKFQKMVPRFSTLSSLPCESCQLGKHTRVSFPKCVNNRAKSPFEFVHTDVWGPCRTASTLGFQYFVTFIDDYSRLTNAREYFSAPFTSFMSHHGILHQSSCAHTQQNGVAERKNRHLVETARTILLHSNVPFRFWGDAVLTACYLINRMPSSVLHDQIPHSLLFPDQPLYFLPPRVFGCTCFVHILTPGQDKLSAKAMKCLFLGYSRLQKVLPIPILSPLDAMPPRPLQVYHRHPRVVAPLPFAEAPADSLPTPSVSPALALPSPDDLPIAIRKVGCRWVYAVKVGPDGQVDRLKARLVAKGYTQVYGSDYGDTFSPVAKIASVPLLSMAAMGVWFSVQVTPFSIWLETISSSMVYRFSSVVQEFGMLRSTADHSVFYHHNSLGQCIYLVVYVDDIVITGSDQDGIQKLKQHLFTHFQTKDLGKLKYFLGIEIAQSSSGVVLSQRKYALDILEETGMLDCKPVDTPMDPNVKLVPGQGEPLGDPGDIDGSHWDAVIRILRYIKSTPGQGVLYENRGHTQVVGYTDADWAGSPTDRRSTSGYCVFIGGNLISWKSKKQDVVARSSAEAEYRAMALATCELIWLRHLLRELRFGKDEQMKLICDNQAALHIASNPVFHERTKHIEVDCHFIREKIASGCVATSFVNSNDQLADIFTKSLRVYEACNERINGCKELGAIKSSSDKGRGMDGVGDTYDAQVERSEPEGKWEESGLAKFSQFLAFPMEGLEKEILNFLTKIRKRRKARTGHRAPNCDCPMNVKILRWNVRGANDSSKKKVIKTFIRNQRVDLICIQETKIQAMSDSIARSIGSGRFLDWKVVNARGFGRNSYMLG
ncbi:Retrovirus-related Pol polyprotein from transposon RE1 [Vitis vinifera]|uniref:Retrovirus-related Pol polyprotein from transposon RE1 n=1 Tax=Vitis vinifera TaxID=29760 RepID=A0A438HT01_VITVI|nr:Retrovirus-related Pol polyprotein from transposon RE1 [Vitis vinifera]